MLGWDWGGFDLDTGKLLWIAEHRGKPTQSDGDYAELFLNVSKYQDVMRDSERFGVQGYIFWRYSDLIRFINVRDVPTALKVVTGRSDRPESVNQKQDAYRFSKRLTRVLLHI